MPNSGSPDRRRHLASSPFSPAPAPDIETFEVGDRVSHLRHGLGEVIARTEHTVTLRFETGIIRVNSPYERLTRL
ncbi:hypothetical protein GCM10023258_35430 [Terrabacter aeriphilus]|uniref:DUF3553 domain-containing protein n=1 Tax=Terrabacter aeriphilus TaxID=515662 RepID=A0ABP9JN67_9MICO